MYENWSNYASLGYTIMAAEKAGFTQKEIQSLINKLHDMHEMKTIQEAEKAYRSSNY